jgi:hypothetical protein
MGRGWAVGASVALGLTGAQLVLGVRMSNQGLRGIDDPIHILETLAIVLLFAAWAYALAVGAYGSKGSLVALVGYCVFALATGALAFLPGASASASRLALAVSLLNLVVGGAAAGGVIAEIRSRRGPIQWGTAVFFLLPLVLLVLVTMAARSVR